MKRRLMEGSMGFNTRVAIMLFSLLALLCAGCGTEANNPGDDMVPPEGDKRGETNEPDKGEASTPPLGQKPGSTGAGALSCNAALTFENAGAVPATLKVVLQGGAAARPEDALLVIGKPDASAPVEKRWDAGNPELVFPWSVRGAHTFKVTKAGMVACDVGKTIGQEGSGPLSGTYVLTLSF